LKCLIPTIRVASRNDYELPRGPLKMDVPHVGTDGAVKYDFPIVYVRAPRHSPDGRSRRAEVGDPWTMEPGADLVLLYPDGKEEVLVAVNEKESIADIYKVRETGLEPARPCGH
jgi:hypothetical protein